MQLKKLLLFVLPLFALASCSSSLDLAGKHYHRGELEANTEATTELVTQRKSIRMWWEEQQFRWKERRTYKSKGMQVKIITLPPASPLPVDTFEVSGPTLII